MKHAIRTENLGVYGPSMASAVQACVHCGFCLTNCPTYRVMGQEMDSPRGRIILMKEVLEDNVPVEQVLPHVDRCLGCLACETHCPSGVHYRDLLSPFRDRAESQRSRSILDQIKRWLVMQTLPYPGRFRFAAKFAKLGKPFRPLMPASFRAMMDLLPASLPKAERLDAVYKPQGKPRACVALLAGCAQQVLAPSINRATVDVLVRNGVEVLVPPDQQCCGALAWHIGLGDDARRKALANLDAFPFREVDAILTNAAGCGSGLSEYPLMLQGQPEEPRAREFADKVQDVSAFLAQLGCAPPPALPTETVVAYHDACHLSHGQGVRRQPRDLLLSIENLKLVEIPDGEICCGSAGTYNIDQPDTAAQLGRLKAEGILSTKPDYVVMGNIGCLTQIDLHLKKLAHDEVPQVMHTIEFLAKAYSGTLSTKT
jgi:glycolate oxidase iron-sulfur subunit